MGGFCESASAFRVDREAKNEGVWVHQLCFDPSLLSFRCLNRSLSGMLSSKWISVPSPGVWRLLTLMKTHASNNMLRGTCAKIEKRGTRSSLDCLNHSGLLKRDTNTLTGMYTPKISLMFCLSQAEAAQMKLQNGISFTPYAIVFNTCQFCLLTGKLERWGGNLFSSCTWSNCHSVLLSEGGLNLRKPQHKIDSELRTKGSVRSGAMIYEKRERDGGTEESVFLCCALMNASDGEV